MWPAIITVALSCLVFRLWADSLEDANWEREARDCQFNRFMSLPDGTSVWIARQVVRHGAEKAWSRSWETRMADARQASLGVRH